MTASIEEIFILLIVFQVKHFVADFPLQTPYMLRKVKTGTEWIVPLSVHCLVHALLTLSICLFVRPEFWWLSLFDFVAHFAMDRVKASPHLLGKFKDTNQSPYWITFGFDQMIHHLTHIYIIWVLYFV